MLHFLRSLNYVLLLILLAFMACSEIEKDEYAINTEAENVNSGTFISKRKINISEADAAIVASKFFGNTAANSDTRTAAMLNTRQSVSSVVDADNNPTMYIINYANNNGFVIVSATKNYQPVLAYSDKGHFDIHQMNDGAALLFDEYQTVIADINDHEIDSLRSRFAVNWAQFEEPDKPTTAVALSTIENKKQQEIAKWTALGYECHGLGAARYLMDPDKAEGYIRDICAHTNPKYNCMDVNILLIKRTKAQYGPLLKTEWHQYKPFNIDAPNGLAGCVPIAIAQIMRYHEWPAFIPWSKIPISPTATPETHEFIKAVRIMAQAEYNDGGTSSNINKAEGAFHAFDYSTQIKDYYGYSERWTAAREIMAKRPVFMRGENTVSGSGHAWVCDGYKHEQMQFAAAMIMYEPGLSDGESYEFFGGLTETSGQYLHMNWGRSNPLNNGWFYNDYIEFADVNPYNYAKKRKILLVTPNR